MATGLISSLLIAMNSSRFFHALVLVLCGLVLTACGFHLRGAQKLPFSSIYLAMDPYADFTAAVKRQINASGSAKVVSKVEEAEVRMQVVRNDQQKEILTLNSSGTVREYLLKRHFAFRLVGKDGGEIAPLNEIQITRDVSFSDSQALAKEQEEQLLYRDMDTDLIQQLMRRLASARLNTKTP